MALGSGYPQIALLIAIGLPAACGLGTPTDDRVSHLAAETVLYIRSCRGQRACSTSDLACRVLASVYDDPVHP